MAMQWHPETAAEASSNEVRTMAAVLEGRHGAFAAEVADFLAQAHCVKSDHGRKRAWLRVAAEVRRREAERFGP